MTDTPNTIVIVGGEADNQAKLNTQLEPVRVKEDIGLAITSIFHGAVYNINDTNNKIHFYTKGEDGMYTSRLPPGHYSSSFSVLKAISDVLQKRNYVNVPLNKKPQLTVSLRRDNTLHVIAQHMTLVIKDGRNSPWEMLGVESTFEVTNHISVKNINFDLNLEPAFLYVNIVENSYINGKLSRVLDIVPISMKAHWSYYEFARLNFVPIEVKEFSKIFLELRNMNGNYVPFDPGYKTIITLQTKHINRGSRH
jgi:hypothetical protein